MQSIRLNKFGILLVIILFLSISAAIVFYIKANKLESGQKSSNLSVETQKIVEEVSELIMLPEGEDPTIATVSDPEKVRNQPFFANAVMGDKVLIYLKSRKAFLYSPRLKKLVEVAPLSPENPSLNDSANGTTTKSN